MMNLPRAAHPEVMICRDGICHVLVYLPVPKELGKFEGVGNHPPDMLDVMRTTEILVLRNDFGLDECFQLRIHHVSE